MHKILHTVKTVILVLAAVLIAFVTGVIYGQLALPLPFKDRCENALPDVTQMDLEPLENIGYFEKKKTNLKGKY